jgi:hypothetical protein
MSLLDDYRKAKDQGRLLRTAFAAEAKTLLATEAEKLFDAHPELKSFSWTQYTPYFNDGDECTFGTSRDYPVIRLMAGEKTLAEDEDEEESQYDSDPGVSADLKKKVATLLAAFGDEDDFEAMFGDHVCVTVSRRGVSVEEYSHN